MFKKTKELLEARPWIVYIFIIYELLQFIFLFIEGIYNDSYFFPFGFYFFDLEDYGLFELFIYAFAFPVILIVTYEMCATYKIAREIIKTICKIFLLLLIICITVIIIYFITGKSWERVGMIYGAAILFFLCLLLKNRLRKKIKEENIKKVATVSCYIAIGIITIFDFAAILVFDSAIFRVDFEDSLYCPIWVKIIAFIQTICINYIFFCEANISDESNQ